MSAPIAIIQQNTHQPATIHQPQPDTYWLSLFDPAAAVRSVQDHVETLPSSKTERHTMRAYMSSLADYLSYMGASVTHIQNEHYQFYFDQMSMPTKEATQSYIAHCKRRGLSSKTVMRYMASVRLFIRALEEQQAMPSNGNDFLYVMEARRQFMLAQRVKNPAPDTTDNRPGLDQHGKRLTLAQVNKLLMSFEPHLTRLDGLRDLALIYLGITSGLRAAELSRVSLSKIIEGETCYEIHVRGKRGNKSPIGIDTTAHALIMNWVEAFNATVGADDPRRITGDVPIFQSLLRGGNPRPIGLRGYHPQKGMAERAILKIVERRSTSALGFAIAAHDMRRTCAFLLRAEGFEWDLIRNQLRHKSIATTEKYVGKKGDLSKSLLTNRVEFQLPRRLL